MTLEDHIATRTIFPGFYNHAERRVPLRSNNPQDVSLATYVLWLMGGGGVNIFKGIQMFLESIYNSIFVLFNNVENIPFGMGRALASPQSTQLL